ncbi:hypothetical protein DFH08DRAFT_823905 [Mycena albidolilacea]|uniref:Uncharacterized protein n=1 Tax=Mycena albidolilacea TaxID=1033008 RepID=A0AAD7EB86_9AGAR|nr:hypothetical protein DFH08DRAFT_823905 [Mycena albidolilacea]
MPYIVCTVFPFRKPKSSVSDVEEAFNEINVYDDCDISLNVVSGLMVSGTSSVAADFTLGENGGLACTGDAEKSDAEGEAPPSAPLGRGQWKKIGTSRYQGPFWEEH